MTYKQEKSLYERYLSMDEDQVLKLTLAECEVIQEFLDDSQNLCGWHESPAV